MARYAVGDLQGCFAPLQAVLQRVDFDPTRDQLWSVGDLVNRGPQSLDCLRFLAGLGDSAKVVLGNHDLHLLAIAEGIRPLRRGDTLQAVLDAPDAAELLAWLRQRPLFVHDAANDISMAHAGIAPAWTLAQAQRLSDEIQTLLCGPHWRDYLGTMYGDTPAQWHDSLRGPERWRVITNHFTRMRFCRPDGSLDLACRLPPEQAPDGLLPWFDMPARAAAGHTLLFGHWAALMGRTNRPDVIGLDTGCVWGGQLTLRNLDTGEHHGCDCTS